MEHKIAVIAGDGIGPEVLAEGVKVLKAVSLADGRFSVDFTHFPWGCQYYLENGKMMADDGMETLKNYDAIFLGAVGYPGVPDHISLWDLLLVIRKKFDQYINIRPVKLLKGAPTPLKDVRCEDIDMVFITNPNNPTGKFERLEYINKLAEKCKIFGVILMIDECFIDFLSSKDAVTAKNIINEYDNIIILKAFTKFYSIP